MKLFTWNSLVYVIKVDFVFASCVDGVLVLIRIKVTFRVNLPQHVIIEQTLKEGIRNNFGNLNVTNNYTLTFQGVFNIIVLSKMHNKSKTYNTYQHDRENKYWNIKEAMSQFFGFSLEPWKKNTHQNQRKPRNK